MVNWVSRWCVRCRKNIFYNRVFRTKIAADFCARRLGKSYFVVFDKVILDELYKS